MPRLKRLHSKSLIILGDPGQRESYRKEPDSDDDSSRVSVHSYGQRISVLNPKRLGATDSPPKSGCPLWTPACLDSAQPDRFTASTYVQGSDNHGGRSLKLC